MAERQVIRLHTAYFKITRQVTIDEVHMDNGGITFNVKVLDEGRKPFLSRWFNDITPATDFYEKFKGNSPEEEE